MKPFGHGGEIAGGSENEMRLTLGNISSTEQEFQFKNKNFNLLSVHHGTGNFICSVSFAEEKEYYLSLHLWFISQAVVFGKHLEEARLTDF